MNADTVRHALIEERNRATATERERCAIIADRMAANARAMSKDAVRFNKFERRDFDSMSIAYAQVAGEIRAPKHQNAAIQEHSNPTRQSS